MALSSLTPDVRWLTAVALSLIASSCLLLTTVGLPWPALEVYGTSTHAVRIGWPFAVAVVLLFTIGWTLVGVGVLALPPPLRIGLLALFSVALVAVTLFGTGASRAESEGIALAPVVTAPVVAALVLIWAIALYRYWRRRRNVSLAAALGLGAAVAVLFGLLQYASATVVEGLEPIPDEYRSIFTVAAASAYLNFSIYLLFPLYTLVGFDLSELLFGGARQVLHAAERLGGDWIDSVAGVAVGLIAVLTQWVFRREALQSPLYLIYTAAWVVVTLWFLRVKRVRRAILQDPSFTVAFGFVTAVWVAYLLLSAVGVPRDLFVAQSLIGSGCLLIAAALLRSARGPQDPGAILLGLIGIWTVFLNLPQALLDLPAASIDFLGATDPVTLSGLVLVVIAIAAPRDRRLVALRTIAIIWTVALILVRYFVALVLQSESFLHAFDAVQLLLLLAAFALAARTVPLRIRVAGASVATVTVGGSIYFALRGEAPVLALAILLAVGVLWHVLMSGRRLTNHSSPMWPRDSRVVMYLGYTLIGLAVALFFTTAQGTEQLRVPLSIFPAVGLRLFGVPTILYLLFAGWTRAHRSVAPANQAEGLVAESKVLR